MPKARWSCGLLALAVLAACTEGPATRRVPVGASSAPNATPINGLPNAASTAPNPPNSGQGDQVASGGVVAPPASVAPAQTLQKPSGSVITMAGVAKLNPAYVVASGAGQIIAAGGGNVIAAGGGNVIAAGGGNVVAAGGGNVIAAGGGNVIAAGGGNVIAAGGGNVIAAGGGNVIAAGGGNVIAAGGGNALGVAASNLLSGAAGSIIAAGGGNVIAAGGGNVIAAGGGNVIAAGGGNYRLAQAANEAALPVVGLVISAFSLADHKPYPLGQDASGRPVYNVYTDAQGRFEVFLPAEAVGNVFLVGSLKPDSPDPRLAFGVVASSGEQAIEVDETANVITQILREVFASRVARIFAAPNATEGRAYVQALVGSYSSLPSLVKTPLIDLLNTFVDAGQEAKLNLGKPQARMARALKISDLALNAMNLDSLEMINPASGGWAGPQEKALLAFRQVLKKSEASGQAKLASGPVSPRSIFKRFVNDDGTNRTQFEVALNEGLIGPSFLMQRPEDGTFLLSRVLFSNPNPNLFIADGVGEFLTFLGTSDIDQAHIDAAKAQHLSQGKPESSFKPPVSGDRISAAARVVFLALVQAYANAEVREAGLAMAKQPYAPDELASVQAAAQADAGASPDASATP